MMVAARIIPCKAHLQAKYPQVICPLKCGSAVSPCDLGCLEQTDQSARLKDALTVPPQPESSTYPERGGLGPWSSQVQATLHSFVTGSLRQTA